MGMLNGKVALITGGTTGIGRAAAVELARNGAAVAVAGRRAEEGAKTLEQVKEAGGRGLFIQADFTVEADIVRSVAETVRAFGRLDVAFNNAGVEKLGPITQITAEDFRAVFDLNVLGVALSMKHQIPAMLKTGGGSIINTSSVAGRIGMGNVGLYVASKHAVEGLTKSAALEYARQNIRVNAVAPAAIRTEMYERFAGQEGSETDRHFASMHPVGRVGRVEEVVGAVAYLASDAASFVTGQSLAVDGGFLAQ